MNSGDIVNLDDTSVPHEYFGKVYVGNDKWPANTLFDTTIGWTVISDKILDDVKTDLVKVDENEKTTETVYFGPHINSEG